MAVVIYGVSAIYSLLLFRQRFRKDDRIQFFLILTAFLFHTVSMLHRGYELQRCPITNFYEITTFISWTMALVYLSSGLVAQVRFLGAFASPVFFTIGVFALMPSLDKPPLHQQFSDFWSSMHAALIILSYGAFGLGSVSSLMFLIQERDLKLRRIRAFQSLMPPIQRLEAVSGGLVWGGFALLSGGLVLTTILMRRAAMELAPGESMRIWEDHKIIWSGLVWSVCMVLLGFRWRGNLKGRPFAFATVIFFLFILTTYWRTNLLSNLHN